MKLKRQKSLLEMPLLLFATLLILAGISVWLLLPQVKENLRLEEQLQLSENKNAELKVEYDQIYKSRTAFEAEASLLAERFENPVDKDALEGWIRTNLKDALVKGTASKGFSVETIQNGPKSFFMFVEKLDQAPWPLKVSRTVSMTKIEGTNGIKIRFILQIASRSTANKPFEKQLN